MKRVFKQLVSGIVIAVAAPAALCSAAPVAIGAPAHSPEATALVALLTPADMVARLSGSVFDKLIAGDTTSPAAQEFAAHPGMRDFVAARVRERMLAVLTAELPDLRDQIATRIESDMTPAEIKEVSTFFESATGTRMRKMIYDHMTANPPVPGHEDDATQAAVADFMKTLTSDDYPVLIAFGSSSGAAKMKTINPDIAELSKRWGEDVTRAHAADIRAVAAQARQDFLAKPKGS
jgi:hypothetical protein